MTRARCLAVLIIAGISGTGCSEMNIQDFAGRQPQFMLEEYFEGRTRAWGLFEDRFGTVRREFVVDIVGTRDGDTLTLDESFVYADGEIGKRIWRISRVSEHTYEGRADDVIGVATGTTYGNALNWRYDLDLKVGDRTWRVHFDDWMFRQSDDIVINRARMSKFGIELGTVTLVFQKQASGEDSAASDQSSSERRTFSPLSPAWHAVDTVSPSH